MRPLTSRPAITGRRRPLGDAAAQLGRPGTAPRRHGAEFLAELLDFDGAMRLVHALDGMRPAAGAPVPNASDAIARVHRDLAEAENESRRPLRDPRTGGALVPAERLERVLSSAGAPASRQRKSLESAGHELFAPVEAATLRRLQTVRALASDARRAAAGVVAASGPAGARLEQIDAALAAATAARRDALFARAVTAAGDGFVADLVRAVQALPRTCDALPVTTWCADLVPSHIARCEALLAAVCLHERARIEMLLRATLGERAA